MADPILTRRVQVIIEADGFRDALYFPEGAVPPDEEVKALAQARVSAHEERLKNPPAPREPTEKEKDAELGAKLQQIRQLQAELADVPIEKLAEVARAEGLGELAIEFEAAAEVKGGGKGG